MGFHGVVCATKAALYRLKKGTVRPLDRQNAEADYKPLAAYARQLGAAHRPPESSRTAP